MAVREGKRMYREQLLAAYQKRYGCLPANVDVFWTYLQTFHSNLHLSQTIYQELAAWFALKSAPKGAIKDIAAEAIDAPLFRSPVGEELERDTKQ